MLSPNTGQPMRLVAGEPATYTLRGEQFEVAGPAWECDATGERFVTDEQDHQMHERLHQLWRARHGLSREALRERRKALGLRKREAATLLGLGRTRYHAYERTHRLPSLAHGRLLALLLSETGVAALLAAGGEALPPALHQKLRR